jgi:hypothetical protein
VSKLSNGLLDNSTMLRFGDGLSIYGRWWGRWEEVVEAKIIGSVGRKRKIASGSPDSSFFI